ncbi:MAG: sodium ion-translocating decarboxylase subunit beta [Clostridia bacterium]|nr:sodium ion-translocating decarboxylase subunit beta [Clostridia bacterium]
MLESIVNFLHGTGIAQLFSTPDWWQTLIMFAIGGVLVYLAIAKGFEPLLLLPIAIGMILTNLPGAGLFHLDFFISDGSETDYYIMKYGAEAFKAMCDSEGHILLSAVIKEAVSNGGLLDLLYLGVKLGIYPCLIFIGIGAMTDFTPLISNPKSLLIGAGAQLGVFVAFFLALASGFFSPQEAASIGIIGGADGPTAILVTKTLAPSLLGAIAIAAYSYMALIPMIQPPFMKLFTTEKERKIKMTALRPVSQVEKIIFPIVVTAVVGLIVPDALALVGCLMFGNLLNVCGVCDRLSKTAQNEMMNIVTIFLGLTVGATASAANFLSIKTLLIIGCGLAAFCVSTMGGLATAKIMNFFSGGTINPLIGSAGVSAVPMAARVSQKVGQKYDPSNFLLMHAMGPNVAGVIGSAVAAGVFLSWNW